MSPSPTPPPRRPRPAAAMPSRPSAAAKAAPVPLSEQDIDSLQRLLDSVPAPLESLDVSMLDGYLCGVLVQPVRVPDARWLAHVTDIDGRALPHGFDATLLHALARRRHQELDDAISRRQWFDPLVFELAKDPADTHASLPPDVGDDDLADPDDGEDHGDEAQHARDAVLPWVAGFATALETFTALSDRETNRLTEPLALLYRHLEPDDLEDADDLLEEIESLEPAANLEEAVEGLVRATLLLADVGRPLLAAAPRGSPSPRGLRSSHRAGPPRRGGGR